MFRLGLAVRQAVGAAAAALPPSSPQFTSTWSPTTAFSPPSSLFSSAFPVSSSSLFLSSFPSSSSSSSFVPRSFLSADRNLPMQTRYHENRWLGEGAMREVGWSRWGAARLLSSQFGAEATPLNLLEPDRVVVTVDEGTMRLDRWLREHYRDLPVSFLMRLIRQGQVRVLVPATTADSSTNITNTTTTKAAVDVLVGESIGFKADPSRGQKVEGSFRLQPGYTVLVPAVCSAVSQPDKRAKLLKQEKRKEDAFPAERFTKTVGLLKETQAQKARDWVRSMTIYEDDMFMALNKPAGIVSAQGSGNSQSIEKALEQGWDGKRWLVHRLDKGTTGVLLIAKTRRLANYLATELRERRVTKTYWALVSPSPKLREGRIKAPLFRGPTKTSVAESNSPPPSSNKKKNKRSRLLEDDHNNDGDGDEEEEGEGEGAYNDGAGDDDDEREARKDEGKPATTEFTVLEKLGDQAALVSFSPLTGRKHQIRVHAASILETPIVGDTKYGTGVPDTLKALWPKREADPGLCLHAKSLHFMHPTQPGNWITIRAPLPLNFNELLKRLGFQHQNRLEQQDTGATKRQLDAEQWKQAKALGLTPSSPAKKRAKARLWTPLANGKPKLTQKEKINVAQRVRPMGGAPARSRYTLPTAPGDKPKKRSVPSWNPVPAHRRPPAKKSSPASLPSSSSSSPSLKNRTKRQSKSSTLSSSSSFSQRSSSRKALSSSSSMNKKKRSSFKK